MTVRDAQRQRLYNWEYAIPAGKTVTLAQALDVAVWGLQQYGITRVPTIGDGRGRRKAAYSSWSNEIKLPRWARTEQTVLHEVAHMVIRFKADASAAAHGPEYARVLVDLWVRRGLVTNKEARASARKARVKVARKGYPVMLGVRAISRLANLRAERVRVKARLDALDAEISAIKSGQRAVAAAS